MSRLRPERCIRVRTDCYPTFVVGLLCDFHDLDGPLLLTNDRSFGLIYTRGAVAPPSERLWG